MERSSGRCDSEGSTQSDTLIGLRAPTGDFGSLEWGIFRFCISGFRLGRSLPFVSAGCTNQALAMVARSLSRKGRKGKPASKPKRKRTAESVEQLHTSVSCHPPLPHPSAELASAHGLRRGVRGKEDSPENNGEARARQR